MEHKNTTALEEYINKVYAIILLSVPGACQAAGLLYTFQKAFGLFPTVSWMMLIIFDITCLLYLAIGIWFVKTGYAGGSVKPQKLKHAKVFLIIIMFIQYNFIYRFVDSSWRSFNASKRCTVYSQYVEQSSMYSPYACLFMVAYMVDRTVYD